MTEFFADEFNCRLLVGNVIACVISHCGTELNVVSPSVMIEMAEE